MLRKGLDKFPGTLRHGGTFGAGAIPASLGEGQPFEADIAHLGVLEDVPVIWISLSSTGASMVAVGMYSPGRGL